MENMNFVAIDVETMTAERTSICAIGLVKVVNSIISQKFYSLIKPIPDYRSTNNSWVNGITPDMVVNSPTIADVWPIIQRWCTDVELVSHNNSFDINALDQCMEYYGLNDIPYSNTVDTLLLTGRSLDEACEEKSIKMECHHDALSDATCCVS